MDVYDASGAVSNKCATLHSCYAVLIHESTSDLTSRSNAIELVGLKIVV